MVDRTLRAVEYIFTALGLRTGPGAAEKEYRARGRGVGKLGKICAEKMGSLA
jgi:hypothetical protein